MTPFPWTMGARGELDEWDFTPPRYYPPGDPNRPGPDEVDMFPDYRAPVRRGDRLQGPDLGRQAQDFRRACAEAALDSLRGGHISQTEFSLIMLDITQNGVCRTFPGSPSMSANGLPIPGTLPPRNPRPGGGVRGGGRSPLPGGGAGIAAGVQLIIATWELAGAIEVCRHLAQYLFQQAVDLRGQLQGLLNRFQHLYNALALFGRGCALSAECQAELDDHRERLADAISQIESWLSDAQRAVSQLVNFNCNTHIPGAGLRPTPMEGGVRPRWDNGAPMHLDDLIRWLADNVAGAWDTLDGWEEWSRDFAKRCPCDRDGANGRGQVLGPCIDGFQLVRTGTGEHMAPCESAEDLGG